MQNYKDNQLITDENAAFEMTMLSVLGDREAQEDCFGYDLKNGEGLVVICDGMGGHDGGRIASSVAVEKILSAYRAQYPCAEPTNCLIGAANEADRTVAALTNAEGKPLRAGTTMVAVVVRDGELFWTSVGDSRAYLFRGSEFVQITEDHNYQLVLDERLAGGVISREEFERESLRGEALISFLGIGDLRIIDYNAVPLKLYKDDKILLMSDGLYKLVSDEEIQRIVENFSNIGEALQALDMKAKKNAKYLAASRDNMTVALIKIK